MTKKRILITGAVSLLGRYLIKVLKKDYELFATVHRQPTQLLPETHLFFLDISHINQVKHLVTKIKPHVVIHLAAMSNIDYCEKYPREAFKANVGGTANIVKSVKASSTQLILCSSNAIFSGQSPPYKETDTPNPLNFYGKTKYEAEKLVQNSGCRFAIIRFTSIFGWPPAGVRDNDVTYYTRELNKKPKLFLVNDRFFNPAYAQTAAEAVCVITTKRQTGIFHVAGKTRINRFTFVQLIKKTFVPHSLCVLKPVSSDFFPHLAPRPQDATLTTDSMKKLGVKVDDLADDLVRMRREKSV